MYLPSCINIFEIFNGIFYHFVNNNRLNLPVTNHVYNLYIINFPSLLTLKTLFSFEIFLILSYSPTSKSNPKLYGNPNNLGFDFYHILQHQNRILNYLDFHISDIQLCHLV